MSWWSRFRARRRRDREVRARLDELFATRPDVLAQGRLKPHHRNRVNVLEVHEDASGAIASILFGIVRHPKAHPLAPRGEEVVELLLWDVGAGTIENVGSRNVTRTS